MTHEEFTSADPDKDGTLTKDEHLTVVEKQFKAADPDNEGTVSTGDWYVDEFGMPTRLITACELRFRGLVKRRGAAYHEAGQIILGSA